MIQKIPEIYIFAIISIRDFREFHKRHKGTLMETVTMTIAEGKTF
jgi:hypothetical protein